MRFNVCVFSVGIHTQNAGFNASWRAWAFTLVSPLFFEGTETTGVREGVHDMKKNLHKQKGNLM